MAGTRRRPRGRRARTIVGLVSLALLGFLVYATFVEPARLVRREAAITLARWPASLDGLRVVAVSDLHAGGWSVTAARIDALVERVNAERADLVVLLGDFARSQSRWRMEPEELARHLAPLRASRGVFAVLGNHDWWYDGERVRRALEAASIRVLEGEPAAVSGGLWIAGIPDEMTRDPRPANVLDKIPGDAPVLAITHSPDVFPDVPARVAITLAGHTHGGQVRLPIVGAPFVPSRFGQRYLRGHIVENGRQLYVTSGVGTSILPLRFGVPPEYAVLTLRAPAPRGTSPP
jgi:hypothetical protein